MSETGCASITTTTTTAPLYGWCKGKHRPKVAAQSGHRGYCRKCFGVLFPKESKTKNKARKKQCPICRETLELRDSKSKICAPCSTTRKCMFSGCENVNDDPRAHVCGGCERQREGRGASQKMLALWCPAHTTSAERDMGLCRKCYDRKKALVCAHCDKHDNVVVEPFTCAQRDCKAKFHLCSKCKLMGTGKQALSCKACWRANGQICVYCNAQSGRNNLKNLRSCRPCFTILFCSDCEAPPGVDQVTEKCLMCESLALWCTVHNDERGLQSGLCSVHYEKCASQCQHCDNPLNISSGWHHCVTEQCGRQAHVCSSCSIHFPGGHFTCETCWKKEGGFCIKCKETPAQNACKYMHMCKKCFHEQPPEILFEFVREESRRYLEKPCKQQVVKSSAPALQLLVVPPSSSNKSLPKYAVEPTYLSPSHCRLCLQAVDDSNGLIKHLEEGCPEQERKSSALQEYRQEVFAKVMKEWPQPISPQVLRSRLAAFKNAMSDEMFKMSACASCARQKRNCELKSVIFPPSDAAQCPSWLEDHWDDEQWAMHREAWFGQLDDIFNIESYLRVFFKVQERLSSAAAAVAAFEQSDNGNQTFTSQELAESWFKRAEQWAENLRRDLIKDSVPAPGEPEKRWLLFKSAALQVDDRTGAISCSLCENCLQNLAKVDAGGVRKPHVKMPRGARANGLWHGPDPEELQTLSYAECKVINMARIYVSVKRIFLERESYAGTSHAETPQYHQRNVVAYPQSPDAALRSLGMSPETLSKTLLVQFVGGDRQALRFHPDLQVSVQRLRKAFLWLSVNCWPFMETTKHHVFWDSQETSSALTSLLQQYEKSVGCSSGGVPAEILQGASRIPADRASVVLQGPANCTSEGVSSAPLSFNSTNQRSGAHKPDTCEEDQGERDEAEVTAVGADEVQCAAALNGGLDDFGPLQLWDAVMKKYKLAQICQRELARLDAVEDKSKCDKLRQEEAMAVAEAVEGIAKLCHQDVLQKLQHWSASESGSSSTLVVPHSEEFLRANDPGFWCMCFLRLFPRGDCAEKCPERPSSLSRQDWVECLLERADVKLWRLDVEFVATLYNIFLRRDQMQAVEAYCQKLHNDRAKDIGQLTAAGLVAKALASGDVDSVRQALRDKNLDVPIKRAMRSMQIVQNNVRGSEAERDNIRSHFVALRLWSGCSSLFFTLNPHDIRSPLTVLLLQEDFETEKRFSLDLSDEEAKTYLDEYLIENPRRLHELVNRDPLVATRVFHWTVRLVISELFNCADKPGQHVDNIPANGEPGVFGHVRAYLGAVEPQMRKALHIHMLIQLLGFAHPDDLFARGTLVETFKRVWYFVASVSFRSTEAFAAYLQCDSAMEQLQKQPLLPLTPKQRGMIGENRTRASVTAQLRGRGLVSLPLSSSPPSNMAFFPSSKCADPEINASAWSQAVVREVQHRTQKTGNHVCKVSVCHKGRIGKKGFCRMLFWHWSRSVDDKKKEVAKRMHGLRLQSRWNGTGAPPISTAPPHLGLPSLETTHPFHFKMTPSMLLGPQCNHDLGVLLRICSIAKGDGALTPDQLEGLRNNLFEAIGDHEHYCAAYSSKEQPHVEGLLVTLADALKSKEEEIARRRADGFDVKPEEVARQILHRLQSATNRRMHKGFPEMLTYLLKEPMEYCSHEFVTLNVHNMFRKLIATFYKAIGMGLGDKPALTSKDPLKVAKKIRIGAGDYEFRPQQLESFPLYFFIAATDATRTRGANTMPWQELRGFGSKANHSKTNKSKQRQHGSSGEGVGTAPPLSNKTIQRQGTARKIMGTDFPEIPLRNEDTFEILYEYDYYVHVRLQESWRVPVVFGSLPRAPENDATSYDKGVYALMMILLFDHYRYFDEIIERCGLNVIFRGTQGQAWDKVYAAFQEWRNGLATVAERYNRDGVTVGALEPLTEEWWKCLIYERMRNYDAIHRRHGTEVSKAPMNLSTLPAFLEATAPCMDDDRGGIDARQGSNESSNDCPHDSQGDFLRDPEQLPTKTKSKVEAVSKHCGSLPPETRLEDFHEPPQKIHARNVEGRYWQDFAGRAREAIPSSQSESALVNTSSQWKICGNDALSAAGKQVLFFKSIDMCKVNLSESAYLPLKKKDEFDHKLEKAVQALPSQKPPSDTVVLEAAFFLLGEGLLNIPDVGIVNVKQARAFLWNALWLQEHMSDVWRQEGHLQGTSARPRKLENFCLAIVGPGGTGKTAVLKITEALTVFFAGTDTVRKLAPSNAAARLLGGDTLHALCKLPFGNAKLTSKQGRLGSTVLNKHRQTWQNAISAFLDEISMVSADQFLQTDVRMRQGKMKPDLPFGGLALNVCGDFLQLPPVDKDGGRKSLAMPLGDDDEDTDVVLAEEGPTRQEKASKQVESQQGLALWKTIKRVVSLTVNVRAPGVLSRLQSEMRAGCISDEMWDLYMSRVITPQDARLTTAGSPFVENAVHFIVHRHRIRVLRSLENAKEQSRLKRTPLYIVQAHDEAVRHDDVGKLTPEVHRELLNRVNPEQTKSLPSFLPLYVGMRLLLSSKECVRFGIMKGCPCIVRHIVFADDEPLPQDLVAGQPHHLQYMPVSLVLQVEGAMWTLPAAELPVSLPADIDRRGIFQLRPTYDYLNVRVGEEYMKVRRTGYLVAPEDTVTVYAAQGSTWEAVIADMQKPPNYDTARHWLACYVMLSRTKSLEGFLVLRPATRRELSARPPQYLLDELDRLLALEESSRVELEQLMKALNVDVPRLIVDDVLAKDASAREARRVQEFRGVADSSSPAGRFRCVSPATHKAVDMTPKRRLSRQVSQDSPMAPGKDVTTPRKRKNVLSPASTPRSRRSVSGKSSVTLGSPNVKGSPTSTNPKSIPAVPSGGVVVSEKARKRKTSIPRSPGLSDRRLANDSQPEQEQTQDFNVGSKTRKRNASSSRSPGLSVRRPSSPMSDSGSFVVAGLLTGAVLAAGVAMVQNTDNGNETKPNKITSEVAAAAAEKRRKYQILRGIGDASVVPENQPLSRESKDYEEFGGNVARKLRVGLQQRRCTSDQHFCSLNIFGGCSSCHQSCHKDCTSDKCKYEPCGICLSMGIPTHAGSDECKRLHGQDETTTKIVSAEGSNLCAVASQSKSVSAQRPQPFQPVELRTATTRTSEKLPKSLTNEDNRCYMNAVLQSLFHCRCFVREARRLLPQINEATSTAALPPAHRRILQDYRRVYESSAPELYYVPDFMHQGRQEDAQEFLTLCLGADGSDASPLTCLWTGTEEKRFHCPVTNCQHWQYELECKAVHLYRIGKCYTVPLRLLQLHVEDGSERFTDLQRCIDHYEQVQRMDKATNFKCVHCDHSSYDCGNTVESAPFEQSSLRELPELLVIQLRRFSYDLNIGDYRKIRHRVDFSDVMPLKGNSYKLRGVVYHGGTKDAGHYWSYVSIAGNAWALCNDGAVRRATQNEPWQSCVPFQEDPVAYLLFYEKMTTSSSASSQ